MNFEALDYLSQASRFRVEKVYACDACGNNTDYELGYKVTMPSTHKNDEDEIYAFIDEDGIKFHICGGYGYDAYDAEIDIDALKELKGFCETITRGGGNGR